MLDALPEELIHTIAFLHTAHQPLGPPTPFLDLIQVNRRLRDVLGSSTSLKSRIFKLKFDSGAVRRRAFEPDHDGYADQLVQYCTVLRGVKSRRWDDSEDVMLGVWVMMMENDGKNYAQLEWAGVHSYVDTFLRQRLWDGSEWNKGWALETPVNAWALSVSWMTSNRLQMLTEASSSREELVSLILPYVLFHRYPTTEAPPNHPFLPLSQADQRPIALQTHAGPSYPTYQHDKAISLPYFGSRPRITPPLASTAARLLFASRRELSRLSIPVQLPEDYEEINRGRAAQVVRGAKWDWDEGCAFAVNTLRIRNVQKPGPQGTKEEADAFLNVLIQEGDDGGIMNKKKRERIEDGDEESRKWDADWWRRRLCADIRQSRPVFTPSLFFKPGSFRGLWQGRLYMPQADAMQAILNYPAFPEHFTERSVNVVMIPIFFTVDEHHRICHCPIPAATNESDLFGTRLDPNPQNSGCGVIPVPKPSIHPPDHLRWLVQTRYMYSRTDAPAPTNENHPSQQQQMPIFGVHHPEGDPDSSPAVNPASPAAEASSSGVVVPITTKNLIPIEIDYSMTNAWFPGRGVPPICFFKRKVDRLVRDSSPSEEGTGAGAAGRWMKKRMRDEIVFGVRGVEGGVDSSSSSMMMDWRKVDGKCRSVENSASTSASAAAGIPPKGVYVYETYDPDLPSSHESDKCGRCKQWEEVLDRERRKAGDEAMMKRRRAEGGEEEEEDVDMCVCGEDEEDVEMDDGEEEETTMAMTEKDQEAIRQLEDAMSTVGYRTTGVVSTTSVGDPNNDEGMVLEPIDEAALDFDFDFDPHYQQQQQQQQQQQILGDDEPTGQPPLYDPKTGTYIPGTRRVFDPLQLLDPSGDEKGPGFCCCSGGIRDVILTGETGKKHIVWHRQKYRIFGRVRKWDGLVGFVRVDQGVWEAADAAMRESGLGVPTTTTTTTTTNVNGNTAAAEAITHMIILGYVVGEKNFVGEWRMAAGDPIRPGWGGPVFMCRRDEPERGQGGNAGGGVGYEPVGGEAVWI